MWRSETLTTFGVVQDGTKIRLETLWIENIEYAEAKSSLAAYGVPKIARLNSQSETVDNPVVVINSGYEFVSSFDKKPVFWSIAQKVQDLLCQDEILNWAVTELEDGSFYHNAIYRSPAAYEKYLSLLVDDSNLTILREQTVYQSAITSQDFTSITEVYQGDPYQIYGDYSLSIFGQTFFHKSNCPKP